MFAAYVPHKGHAFIDRALYLPKAWTPDPARMQAGHVPDTIIFVTKPALASAMIGRAINAGVQEVEAPWPSVPVMRFIIQEVYQ